MLKGPGTLSSPARREKSPGGVQSYDDRKTGAEINSCRKFNFSAGPYALTEERAEIFRGEELLIPKEGGDGFERND